MKVRRLFTAVVVTVIANCIAQDSARSQQPSPTTVQVRQVAYIKASNAGAGGHFGCGGGLQAHAGNGVAISRDGNTLAIGAHLERSTARGVNGNQNDDSLYDAGAVYVFVRRGETWEQQAYIKASNAGENDNFGYFVALSADGKSLYAASGQDDAVARFARNTTDCPRMPEIVSGPEPIPHACIPLRFERGIYGVMNIASRPEPKLPPLTISIV